MREPTIKRLIGEFGPPSSSTDKVLRWALSPSLDMVVQRDASPSDAPIWIPWNEDDQYASWAEYFGPERGRHSGTYHSDHASLARGRGTLRMRISRRCISRKPST